MFSLNFEDLRIILLSALPVTELRLTIPLAVALGISPVKSFILACVGNFLPVIPLLLLLEPISRIVEKLPCINKMYAKLLEKTRAKGQKVEKYGALGLLLFVAVPFPGTGVYSGAILAFLFGIRFWYSFISLTIGMLLAGISVTLASAGAKEIADYIYNLEFLLVVLFVGGIIYLIFRKTRKKSL